MSYILDALRRAERERNLGEVPDLRNGHRTLPPARRRLWGWLVATALTINAVGIVFLSRQSDESAPHTQSSNDAPRVNSGSDATAPDPVPSQPDLATATAPPRPASTGIAPPDMSEPVSPVAEPLPTERMPSESDRHAPLLTALPQDFVRSVPELRLDVHVFSDERAQRFVVLNSRHYREGDHTHEGPRLEVITRDGAILSFRGRRFLVPVYH